MQIEIRTFEIRWTAHAQSKMRQYGLSQSRVRRIIHSPSRVEEGIAEDTIAFMQKAGSVKHPYELWVMAQDKGRSRAIISAWRYPGVTKPGAPLPSQVRSALSDLIIESQRENEV